MAQQRRSPLIRNRVALIAVAAAVLLLTPLLLAGGLGRMLGSLWVSSMAVVAGLIGGLFGG